MQDVDANFTVGWDIGGAHLKAAVLDDRGRLVAVEQLATPLWEGLETLDRGLRRLGADLPSGEGRHVVTMTGELVDVFPDRRNGVAGLLEVFAGAFGGAGVLLYGGAKGFIPFARGAGHAGDMASANWHATARFAGTQNADCLLVDIGSTTCDLVPVVGGSPACRGYNDQDRMQFDELLFSGVVRTPVMAVVERVPFRGEWQPVAAEHFADMGDVYRVREELGEQQDLMATADGADKTIAASARRLGRMLGVDAATGDPPALWRGVADYISERQLQRIWKAASRVVSAAQLQPGAPVIGAGAGRFLGERLAGRLGRPYLDFGSLIDGRGVQASRAADCATAVSLARLAFLEDVG